MAPIFAFIGTAFGAPAASAASVGMMATGLGLGVMGQIQAGQQMAAQAEAQKVMAEYNARLQEREAKEIKARSILAQRRQAEAAARGMSTMEAEMGAAGVISTTGTPLLIKAKQASEFELENLMIGYEGQVGASRALSQAALDRMQAKLYGQRAAYARTASYIGAGSTLLTGFGTMAGTTMLRNQGLPRYYA